MQRRIIQSTAPKLRTTISTLFSRPTAAICKPRNLCKPFSTSTVNKLSNYFDNMSLFPRYHSHHHHGGSSSGVPSLWRLLDDPFFVPATSSVTRALFQPKFDVHETSEAFILDGELPGIMDKNAIDIHFTDQQTLVIHGRVEKIRKSGSEDDEEPTESHQATVEDAPEEGETSKPAESKEVAQTGEKSVSQQQQPNHRVWVQERSVGEFQRSFNFPAGIDQDNVKASLKDGILTVTVPKAAQKGKRRINVE